MEIKKKKMRGKKSITVNQPIWRNRLQRISRNLPPEQQLWLPIFTLKVEGELFSLDTICEPLSSQRDTWCRMCIITLQWRQFITEISEWTGLCTGWVQLLLSRNCVSMDKLGFSNILFQKLNPRFTDSSLIKKIMYMREKGLPPKYSLWTSQGEKEQG